MPTPKKPEDEVTTTSSKRKKTADMMKKMRKQGPPGTPMPGKWDDELPEDEKEKKKRKRKPMFPKGEESGTVTGIY